MKRVFAIPAMNCSFVLSKIRRLYTVGKIKIKTLLLRADPGFFEGGGANSFVSFLQNTSCIRKPLEGGGGEGCGG